MTVYLDDWRQPARLGMRREWFQHKEGRPHQAHYDVPDRSRQQALDLGAVSITWRQVGRMMRQRRLAASDRFGGDATGHPDRPA